MSVCIGIKLSGGPGAPDETMVSLRNPGERGTPDEAMVLPRNPGERGTPDEAMVPPRNPGERGAPDEAMVPPWNPGERGAPDEAMVPPRNPGERNAPDEAMVPPRKPVSGALPRGLWNRQKCWSPGKGKSRASPPRGQNALEGRATMPRRREDWERKATPTHGNGGVRGQGPSLDMVDSANNQNFRKMSNGHLREGSSCDSLVKTAGNGGPLVKESTGPNFWKF